MGLINKFPDLADEFEARPAASGEVAPEEGGMDDAGSIASEDNNSIETVADSPVESPEEVPIEQRLEAPRTEMTEKYGEETRQLADSLITRTSERDAKWEELVAGGGADTRPDLWEEYVSLNDECAKLEDSVKNGTGVNEYPSRKTNESWGEYEN